MGSTFITFIVYKFKVFDYFRTSCTGLTLIAIKIAVK